MTGRKPRGYSEMLKCFDKILAGFVPSEMILTPIECWRFVKRLLASICDTIEVLQAIDDHDKPCLSQLFDKGNYTDTVRSRGSVQYSMKSSERRRREAPEGALRYVRIHYQLTFLINAPCLFGSVCSMVGTSSTLTTQSHLYERIHSSNVRERRRAAS